SNVLNYKGQWQFPTNATNPRSKAEPASKFEYCQPTTVRVIVVQTHKYGRLSPWPLADQKLAPTTASGRRSEVVSSPLTAVATQMQPLIPCSHFELPAVRKQTWLLFQNFASLCGNNDQMVLKR
ncbi:hypothetical protein IAQ61_001623, partial [Plenodomus lingam]|uniref:uncharacterized protein n=1 Tax=Leptosphaeria maculans TaxID=5022 RepID=UPI0033220D90